MIDAEGAFVNYSPSMPILEPKSSDCGHLLCEKGYKKRRPTVRAPVWLLGIYFIRFRAILYTVSSSRTEMMIMRIF